MTDLIMRQAAITAIKLTGTKVNYISETGVKKSVYASFERDVQTYPADFETGSATRTTFIEFIKTDVPNIKHGEKIVNGSELFTVADIEQDDGIVIRISVK